MKDTELNLPGDTDAHSQGKSNGKSEYATVDIEMKKALRQQQCSEHNHYDQPYGTVKNSDGAISPNSDQPLEPAAPSPQAADL